jgi:PAS domain S-box-containing protein
MSDNVKNNQTFHIVLTFLLIGCMWAMFSDELVSLVINQQLQTILSILKDWIYVGFTSILLYHLINKNISHLEESRKKIAASEERLNLVLQSVNEGVWDWDLKSGAAYLSPKYLEIVEYQAELIIPGYEFFKSLVHPDDRENTVNAIDTYLSKATSDGLFEFRIITGRGTIKWIQGRGKVVEWDADGQPLRMLGTITDITDRKLVEVVLKESEKRYRAVVEDQTEIITRYRPDGT